MKDDFILTCAIIGGGDGRRAGGNKQNLVLADVALSSHAIRLASGYSPNVIWVSRDNPEISQHEEITNIQDDLHIPGPLAGLSAALGYAKKQGCTHVLSIACDMPFLPADLAMVLRREIGDNLAIFPEYDGRIQPLASLWSVSAGDHLQSYLDGGKRSIIGFGEHIGHATAVWPDKQINPFFNINDLEDLKLAEEMFMLHLRTNLG